MNQNNVHVSNSVKDSISIVVKDNSTVKKGINLDTDAIRKIKANTSNRINTAGKKDSAIGTQNKLNCNSYGAPSFSLFNVNNNDISTSSKWANYSGIANNCANITFTGINSYYNTQVAKAQIDSEIAKREHTKTKTRIADEEHEYRISQRPKEELAYYRELAYREEDRRTNELTTLIEQLNSLGRSNVIPEGEILSDTMFKNHKDLLEMLSTNLKEKIHKATENTNSQHDNIDNINNALNKMCKNVINVSDKHSSNQLKDK